MWLLRLIVHRIVWDCLGSLCLCSQAELFISRAPRQLVWDRYMIDLSCFLCHYPINTRTWPGSWELVYLHKPPCQPSITTSPGLLALCKNTSVVTIKAPDLATSVGLAPSLFPNHILDYKLQSHRKILWDLRWRSKTHPCLSEHYGYVWNAIIHWVQCMVLYLAGVQWSPHYRIQCIASGSSHQYTFLP